MALLNRDGGHTADVDRPIEHSLSHDDVLTPSTTQAQLQGPSTMTSLHALEAIFPSRPGLIAIVPGFEVSFSDADQILEEYIVTMIPQFPFVPLPSHNAYEMYKDRPLLLKTILWVCKPPGPEAYAAFESWFRQHIAHQAVVLMNKNLELIQVLLVFFACRPLQGVHPIVIASMQNELDAFIHQLPDHLKWNHLLRTHCAAVRIHLLEPFKYGDMSGAPESNPQRCQTIWGCLRSTQELYDAFRLVPVESYPSLTFVSILHLALAIIKALRFLCVEDHSWDLDTARIMYNMPDVLQNLSKQFEDANSRSTPRSRIFVHGRPIFSDYAEAYRGIERWYSSRLDQNVAHLNLASMWPIIADGGDQNEGFEF
ncbi:hypothetical protein F4677DRAFT_464064 [Hypoxylon crocopeplum]|nr:hypothetical protein F4677DRAFT_464064 [Hypoxylon crocopeplum]